MTDIFVVGGSKDKEIEALIKTRLSASYAVTYITRKSFCKTGNGYNLVFFDAEKPEITADRGILLMKENGAVPKRLPAEITAIINEDNEAQLKAVQKQGIRAVTCGCGATATISFSSETEDMLTVSLNRGITALSGKSIEPLEIPLERDEYSRYTLMSFAALRLLLDDFDSELGRLM